MSMLENRETMVRRGRRPEALGASANVGSSPRPKEFLPQKGRLASKSRNRIIHCSLFIIHCFLSIAKKALISPKYTAIFPPATPKNRPK
jgi:hypothetical protein